MWTGESNYTRHVFCLESEAGIPFDQTCLESEMGMPVDFESVMAE